ncbi:16S rRNA (guanine(527)-N(7))-methyltransferase RsmG [Gilvimarinus agarilyticus]|uniref:16S rRNA (guanine(527)-N(7))-methyltransferase RsmG n=1 Tax=Gilvimarinus sp. 2_MG-2023 TaxID=3062666 RepID=UPI001C0852B8|nr:16S rRNA (guanine(527)-N(7))-methyltransferase RsmG [Gilvimarinus sp. 2_MG-2023]MBU2884205.1 16S rRNA (guanine(527)-N(7))-methyltransferase RsmG [Gilvimarinus agarilyticus]MDO6569344.1 16S rRNA (guanine(527)-N(7))-methyltransferase RsmG [Gilvimarinus sp. 2_MG-2023]
MALSLRAQLEQGVQSLSLTLAPDTIEVLLQYLQEFSRWNKAYNLSAVRNIDQMVSRHLLDSLAILPHLPDGRFIDVGTGGGLPGMVMAICRPNQPLTLLDSNGKKTRFLFHVKTLLGLDWVEVENCRVESHQSREKYQGVVSRAFASLSDMTHWCQHLLADDGCFYAMKGIYPEQELLDIQPDFELKQNIPLSVPGEAGQRHLLVINKRPVKPE